MRTLAKALGLSHTAVSKGLRNAPDISVAMREKIQKTARALGYRPNPLLSAWAAQKRKTRITHDMSVLAYLNCFTDRVEWVNFCTGPRFLAGAGARADELGFKVEMLYLYEQGMTPMRMSKLLHARGIQGLIIGSHLQPAASLEMEWEHFALATQAYSLVSPRLSRTANHYAHALQLGFHKLLAMGYRRIALYLHESTDVRVWQAWSSAYLGCQQFLPAEDRLPILWHSELATRLKTWVKERRPEVFLTLHTELVDKLAGISVRVPDQIAVAILDWHPVKNRGFAGVDCQIEGAGRAAVDLVVTQLMANERGLPERPITVLTEGRWVDGKSAPGKADSERRP